MWARRNTRPRVVRQTEYKWVYLCGAVNPVSGESVGMIASTMDTEMMSWFLYWMGKQVGEGRVAVLVLDGAGWHVCKRLRVPENIKLLILPPYSPELNPAELIWLWLKQHQLSNRVFADQAELDKAAIDAWNTIDADRFKTLCAAPWITRGIQA